MRPDSGADRHRSFADTFRRALRRDPDAWDTLVTEYGGLVFGTALRAGMNRDEAADLTQAVWTTLLEQADSIRDPRTLPKWLAVTSHRMAVRTLRRTRPYLPLADDQEDHGPGSEELLEREERAREVRRALAALSPRCRALLTELFDDDPAAYTEIAAKLGMAVGSIGPNRARCLARLQRILEEGAP